MPIRKWHNWDQGSVNDNLWECLDAAEARRLREERLRRTNETRMQRQREQRLRSHSQVRCRRLP